MSIPFTNLDVFTHTRYLGNALAIIRPPTPTTLSQTQKLQISREFNLSEVVFLHLPESLDSNPKELTVDIFTSTAEIPFAGHPTIGTAILRAQLLGLEECQGINHQGRDFTTGEESQYPVVSIVNGMTFILVSLLNLVDLGRAVEIKNLNPSTYYVEHLDEGWRNGLCSTMYYVNMGEDGEGRRRYRTRMFETGAEDSGTGSASCALACYLVTKNPRNGGDEVKFGFEQGVEMGKRNEIFVDVMMQADGASVEKVVLSGEAVKYSDWLFLIFKSFVAYLISDTLKC
ncbi:hypothetical protein DID88_009284 [Monilinia fructigena]|uniref:Phenazine biosynthesis protein n=1 Tax=Monilinia fructigena TaxID=38457 RepID=A0A395IG17_9HELO|nr:hypothetical protein DID88_009284 [Monilinia fructigena]